MYYAEIVRAVDRLKRRYHETDPIKLCAAMGIILIPQSLGTAQDAIKGFYLESKRIRTITVNSDMPLLIQKFIVAHELGHAELHRKLGIIGCPIIRTMLCSLRDNQLFSKDFLSSDSPAIANLIPY